MLSTKESNKSLNVCLDDNIEKLFIKNNYKNTTTTIKATRTTQIRVMFSGGIWIRKWKMEFGGRNMG